MGLRTRGGPRTRRVAFFAALALGTAFAVGGAIADNRGVLAIGLAITGLGGLMTAKLALESGIDTSLLTKLLGSRRAHLGARVSKMDSRIGRLEMVAKEQSEQLRRASEQLRRSSETLRSVQRRVTLIGEAMSESAAAMQDAIDRLGARVRGRRTVGTGELANNDVADPLLSIAIPSFNRPDKLAECLHSVEREVALHGAGVVEVCITDDASTDPDTVEDASGFAQRLSFVSLRANATNVGLERNLIESCRACRGRYVLILGNDDVLMPNALEMVLDDLRSDEAAIYLYDKVRIDRDGNVRGPVPGSVPVDVPDGAVYRFGSMLEAARRQGLISTFGFISQVVFAREPFIRVDGSTYLDLTMYPQVFILAEAFAAMKVIFRNAPIVYHRTPTHAQKLAESLGRKEEPFMTGGSVRTARYFGPTYAAALQRLIDHGALSHRDLLELPERLMTNSPLIEWIEANCRAATAPPTLPDDVLADSERFFDGIRTARELREPKL
jgi:hypothetical protein